MYDLLIIYRDGTEKVVENVEEGEIKPDKAYFAYTKNGFKAFIPMSEVRFFGRECDYRETETIDTYTVDEVVQAIMEHKRHIKTVVAAEDWDELQDMLEEYLLYSEIEEEEDEG